MIVFHGRGDSIKPFLRFDQEMGLADMNYLLLRAPHRFLGGYSWFAERPHIEKHLLGLRTQLITLLYQLNQKGFKNENIYLLGFSQGSLVASDLALNFPVRFAGVIGISGYFYFFPRWQQGIRQQKPKTPWLFTHGNQDKILPLANTQFGVEKLKSAGLNVQFLSFDKTHVFNEHDFSAIQIWLKKGKLGPWHLAQFDFV